MSKTKQLEEEARQCFQKGKFAYENGETDKAQQELNRALHFFRSSSEHSMLAEIFRLLGEIYYIKGLYVESRNHYKRAFSSFKNFNNKIGMADCYDKVALSFMIQGELQHAKEYQEKALEIRKNTPDKKGMARALKNLAIIKHQLTGESRESIVLLEEAIEFTKKIKEPQFTINLYLDLLKIHMKNNDFEEALQNILLARRMSKKFNIKLPDETIDDFSDILLQVGIKSYEEGDREQALKYLKNAVTILKSRNKPIADSVENIIFKLESKEHMGRGGFEPPST